LWGEEDMMDDKFIDAIKFRSKYRRADIMIHWNNLIRSYVFPTPVGVGREIYERSNKVTPNLKIKEPK